MKTYVVNLDKSVERLKRMTQQLNRLGIEFVRIPAVCGATLLPDQRKVQFSSFRSLLVMGRRLLDGEVGCALSHNKIYRRMVLDRIGIALVLEDDVLISPDIKDMLSRIEGFVDSHKPQVFILSCYDKSRYQKTAIEPIHNANCTDGYVITLPAAQSILRANYPVSMVADSWQRWERKLGLQVYQCMPACVRQYCLGEFSSIIQSEEKTLRGALRNVLHKMESYLCRLKI